VGIVDEPVKPLMAPDLPEQLTYKTGSFQLLEVMYRRLPASTVHGPNAIVNIAFCHPNAPSDKGNDLAQALCKKGLREAVCETVAPLQADPNAALRRLYHCAAY